MSREAEALATTRTVAHIDPPAARALLAQFPNASLVLRQAWERMATGDRERPGNGQPAGRQPAQGPVIRQAHKKTGSKLQTAFLEHLKATVGPGTVVLEESLTFVLANGCRYTPDAMTVVPAEPHPIDLQTIRTPYLLEAWEVKGRHAWDDSLVKLKVAPRLYPWIRWHLVTRRERSAGPWKIVQILP